MRRLIGFLLALLLAATLSRAEQIRVATWNLTWFPSGSPDQLAPEVEEQNISAVASLLNGLQPDVIILQEVRDKEACEQLAQRLGPAAYQVNVCSVFKDGGGPAATKRQVAILSRFGVSAAWAEEWQPEGLAHPPGGFVFAALRCGATDLGVFAVHLKNNVGSAEREIQLNILKRELSAEQLLQQVHTLDRRLTNRLDTLVIAGNFNTDLDQPRFVSEQTLRSLQEAGFRSGFEDEPLSERITCLGKGRYADATFDYLFAKGASLVARPEIVRSELSDHFPVAADLVLTVPPPAPVVSSVVPLAAPPAKRINWPLWGFIAVLLALHVAIWQAVRRRPFDAATAPTLSQTAAGDENGFPASDERIIVPLKTVEKMQSAQAPLAAVAAPGIEPQFPGSAENVLRPFAGTRTQPDRSTALIRSGLLPHLARLMVSKLVQGLMSQRANLLHTQNAASAQITDLEERLIRIQGQLQQRMTAYERRIAELEQEIAAKEKENRELLQAHERVMRRAGATEKVEESATV